MGKRSFVFAFIFYLLFLSLLGFLVSNHKFNKGKEVFQQEATLWKVIGDQLINTNNMTVVFHSIALPNGVYNIVYPYQIFGSEYELKDEDYLKIVGLGMNSVRFYVQYSWLRDDDMFDFFQYLDKQIALAKKHGVSIILNLHYFGEAGQVQRGEEDGFYKGNKKYNLTEFWKKISDKYKHEEGIAAYDLINEPSTSAKFTEKMLYAKYQEIVEMLRANGDRHILIISDPVNKFGNALKNEIKNVNPFIKLSDNNIMYQFHWYEPIEFTHQGFFDSEYFELGADYPMEKRLDAYKGGYYRNPYISETKGQWVEYKTSWVDLDLSNCEINREEDKFNLSLSFSGLKGEVWFDDISLYKKDVSENIVRLPVPNYDVSNSRSFIGWTKNPAASKMPARWNAMNDPKTSGIECRIDWESDHSGNGSGSLYANGAKAKWGKDNPWATWGQSGGALSTYYNIEKDVKYQVRFWVKTVNNPAYNVSVGFGIYNVKEILLNKFIMQNLIHEYYAKWAKKHKVPLFCGEFGTTNPGLLNSSYMSQQQADWVRDMKEILEKEVGSWSYHSYKSYSPRSDLFGLYNTKEDRQIIRVLRNK